MSNQKPFVYLQCNHDDMEKITLNDLKSSVFDYGHGVKYLKHPMLYDMLIGDLEMKLPNEFKEMMLPKTFSENKRKKLQTFGDWYVFRMNYIQKKVQEAIDDKHWDSVLALLPKQERLKWLSENSDLIDDDDKFYDLLKFSWTVTEFPSSGFYGYWDLVQLFYDRGNPQSMMNKEELEVYNNFPDEVILYRGVRVEDELDEENIGLSFTYDKEQAEWFAKRFSKGGGKPTLIEAKVKKSDILSVFEDRNEKEVVVDPEQIEIVKITEL